MMNWKKRLTGSTGMPLPHQPFLCRYQKKKIFMYMYVCVCVIFMYIFHIHIEIYICIFLVMPTLCGRSQARDQTPATAATQVSAVSSDTRSLTHCSTGNHQKKILCFPMNQKPLHQDEELLLSCPKPLWA